MTATNLARRHYFSYCPNKGGNVLKLAHKCGFLNCIVEQSFDHPERFRFYCPWCEKYIKLTAEQVSRLTLRAVDDGQAVENIGQVVMPVATNA